MAQRRIGGTDLLAHDRALDARFVAGADEAGRGALAGPVVAAAVLLVDGFALPEQAREHRALVKGDATSAAIAAASVIAKVTRDRAMAALDAAAPGYGFGAHAGYGTASHREAITRLGPCPAHRHSFAPIALAA